MSDRNKTFRRKYTIEIKGITTNHFMERFIDSYIGRIVLALADRFAQVEILLMTAEEIETSIEVRKVYKCAKCGASKYTEGADCLFCAAEADHADTNV
jgi:hypothetical protein